MKFLDKLNTQWSMLKEADDEQQDATAPDPNAAPEPGTNEPAQVAPAGYTAIVKLLAQAMAMNFPSNALDEIFRTDINNENAFAIQTALEAAIKQNEMYSDNPERINSAPDENGNVTNNVVKYINSINETNYQSKFKYLLSVMKKRNPSLKFDWGNSTV
jgi:hypothetical protein